jgi:hypothetical protein
MEEVDLVTKLTKRVGTESLAQTLLPSKLGLLSLNLKSCQIKNYIIEKEMITDKDAKEYHKLIKKLEEQNKFKKEQQELDTSYKQSKLNKKERDDKEK